MDELTQDIGIELHTESIMHRAEQLARLESDKIVDKVSRLQCLLHNTHTVAIHTHVYDITHLIAYVLCER